MVYLEGGWRSIVKVSGGIKTEGELDFIDVMLSLQEERHFSNFDCKFYNADIALSLASCRYVEYSVSLLRQINSSFSMPKRKVIVFGGLRLGTTQGMEVTKRIKDKSSMELLLQLA